MVQAQFESAQFRTTDSVTTSQSDSASAKMLLESQSYQAPDKNLSSPRAGAAVGAGDNTGTKAVDKEIDKIMNGFAIKTDDAAADKSAIACRMMKGQRIEYGRIISTDKEDDGKPSVTGRDGSHGPTDQDRASRFELYLWNLCNRRKYFDSTPNLVSHHWRCDRRLVNLIFLNLWRRINNGICTVRRS